MSEMKFEPIGAADSLLVIEIDNMRKDIAKVMGIPKGMLKLYKKPTTGEMIWNYCWARIRGKMNADNTTKV